MSIKKRNTCSPNFVASRIRVPGRKRIGDSLPLLCSLQSIRSKGQAKPRSHGDETVAPRGLKGRFCSGRGTPLRAIGEAPVGLWASYRIELQSNPQRSIKCAGLSRADSNRLVRQNPSVVSDIAADLPPADPAVITRVRRFDIRARPPAQARRAGRFHLAGTPGALVPAFGSPGMSAV